MRPGGPGNLLPLLTAVAVVLSACGARPTGVAGSPDATGPRLIPWVDRPMPAYVEPSATPYPTSAPPCRTSQLRIGATHTGVGMSQAVLQVSLINTGSAVCLLRGQPRVTGVTASGVRVTLPARTGPTFAGS